MANKYITQTMKYNKEKTKAKPVRYTNDKALRIEAYCKYKNMGYSELVNALIEKEIQKDGWKYNEGESEILEVPAEVRQMTEVGIDPVLLAKRLSKLLRNPEMVQLVKSLYSLIKTQTETH